MNADDWFEAYRWLPGLFITAPEVDAALAAAPGDIDTRRPADERAFRAALVAGEAAAWWQRRLAGEDVQPVSVDADSEISDADELYAWCWGYEHALRDPGHAPRRNAFRGQGRGHSRDPARGC